MSETTGEQKMTLRDTIVPKSDQLNYDDFVNGPITDTVVGLKQGSSEQPIIVLLKDHDRPYKPCKGMRRVLIAAWGGDDRGKSWIGKRLTMFGEPTVKFAGEQVGGIQVSHVSGITKPLTIKLTVARGKRKDYTVQPLAATEGKQEGAK